MIANPTIYLWSFPLEPTEKVILEGIASIRFRGRVAQPGVKELARWINRSTRTVFRVLAELEKNGLVKRIRRGKKLTNVYYLAMKLWGRLIAGRQVRRERADKRAEVPASPERLRAFVEELKGAIRRGPPTPK